MELTVPSLFMRAEPQFPSPAFLTGFVRFNAARGSSRLLSDFAALQHGSSTLLLQLHCGNMSAGSRHQLRFSVPGKQFFCRAENFVWTWKNLNSAGTDSLETLFSMDEWIFCDLGSNVVVFSIIRS